MNRRLVHVFAFAVIVAAASSFIVYRLLVARIGSAHTPAAPQNKVLVAAHDLQIGSLLTAADLETAPWPAEVPKAAFKDPQEVIGRGVIANIYKEEMILSGRLAPKGAGAGLAATIPLGKRAVALRVNEVVGLAGFVLPGMRVDVVVSGNGPEAAANRTGTLARTILQNIEVLSAGQRIEHSSDGKPSDAQVVNLLVSPDQAEILSLAGSETKVQLVLRNPLDTQEELTQGSSIAKLFYGSAHPPMPAPVPSVPVARVSSRPASKSKPLTTTVEVIQGMKKSEQTFALNGEMK